jgi:type III pantothenate kinase
MNCNMILIIDIGNTNVTLGLYENDELGARWRVATMHERMPDEYGVQFLSFFEQAGIDRTDVDGICLSSVVPPLTSKIIEACERYLCQSPLVVSSEIKTGIEILYENPKQVGADRIADAVAVHNIYGGPACVIDFGTATTFNAITKDGSYLGGAIAPGIRIAADALSSHASKLPKIDLVFPDSVIGQNTPDAMQAGLLYGYVGLVEGMVRRFREVLGPKMKVIATGGLARVISEHTNVVDEIDTWLTMNGLYLIWKMNQPTKES